jgi:hypothetical protein
VHAGSNPARPLLILIIAIYKTERRRGMNKAIEILRQHINSYHAMIELYEAQPHNQAITEYTAKEAERYIKELLSAIAVLNGKLQPADRSEEIELLQDMINHLDCSNSDRWTFKWCKRAKERIAQLREPHTESVSTMGEEVYFS